MQKFFKQFFIYGFASVLGKIAAVFLLPLYTNVLSKEEYGVMAMITAAKGIIDLFSNLNIHSGVARDYYEDDIDRTKLVSTGFFSILFFSFAILIILLITKEFWINNVLGINGYEKAFIIMLCTLPAGSLFSYFGILTRYQQKAVLFSIGNILQLVLQISLTIYFVLILKIGVVGVFYGILAGEIIGIIFFFFINRENVDFVFSKSILQRVLAFSLPTLPAILAGWIDSSLGQVLIGKYISIEEAGVYSIALRISSVFLLIQVALGNVWSPYVYENYKTPEFKRNVIKLFNISTNILIIITLHLALLSDYIVLILSNANYLKAAKYLILLTIPMSFNILILYVNIGAGISRKTKYISYANILGSGINLFLLVIFLPKLGVITVPVALAISKILSYIVSSYYTKKEISLKFPKKNAIILVLSVIFLYYLQSNYEIKLLYSIFGLCVLDIFLVIYYIKHYNLKQIVAYNIKRRKVNDEKDSYNK